MKITEPTVLLPANEIDIGITARLNASGFVAVDLGMGADPITFTPEVVETEMLRLGCRRRPDGTWRLSWRWRKEYLRDATAQAGMPVFDGEWLDVQKPRLREPAYRMDVDRSPAALSQAQARLDIPEGYAVGPLSQREPAVRQSDRLVSLGPAFWRLDEAKRVKELQRWLVVKVSGRVAVYVDPESQPDTLPKGWEPHTKRIIRAFAGGSDVRSTAPTATCCSRRSTRSKTRGPAG